MPKESKTIQVYPSDHEVNKAISHYESWGWEVIGNQRVQEFTGQDSDGTKHYKTFVKLTFSRDKDAPWYDEVISIFNECLKLEDLEDDLRADLANKRFSAYVPSDGPQHPGKRKAIFSIPLCVFLFMLAIFPGVLYLKFSKAARGEEKKAIIKEYNEKLRVHNDYGSNRIKALISETVSKHDKLIDRRNELLRL